MKATLLVLIAVIVGGSVSAADMAQVSTTEAGTAAAACDPTASAHSCSCTITGKKQVGASNNFRYNITCNVNGKECKQTIDGSNDNSVLALARNFCGCD